MTKIFDCMSPSQKVLGKKFLEASAGTGKTYAIEHIVVRMIIEGIAFDSILAVTFTKAATRELRLRIRKNIDSAWHQLQKEKTPEGFAYLKELKKEEALLAVKRLEEAILSFEKMQIYTIHSFCFQMLKEFSFEANLIIPKKQAEEWSFSEALEESIKETLVSSDVLHPMQKTCLMQQYKTVRALSSQVKKYLQRDLKSCKELSFEECLKEILAIRNEDGFLFSEEDFSCLCSQFLKKNRPLDLNSWLDFFVLKDFSSNQLMLLMESASSFFKWIDEGNLKKKADLECIKRLDLFSKIKKIKNLFAALFEEEPLLEKLAKHVQTIIRSKHTIEGQWTYDDFLSMMAQSLKQPKFLSKIQKKYQAVLIDEFQDTDPLQWQIFSTLFIESNVHIKAFYLIGDPKQSIYGFRKADLYTYFQAMKMLGNSNLYHLTTNYRSNATLIDALNSLFNKNWMKLPKMNEVISYLPVYAGREDKHVGPALHFTIAHGDSFAKAEEILINDICKNILDLSKKQIDFSQIALLVKDRFQAQRVIQELNCLHIPCTYRSQMSIADTFAFEEVKIFLLAVLYAPVRRHLKLVLASSFCGWELSSFEKMEENPFLPFIIDRFLFLKEILLTEGIGAFFQKLFSLSFREDKKTTMQMILETRGVSYYHDLMQVMEIIVNEAGKWRPSKEEMIEILASIERKNPEDNEGIRRRFIAEKDCVQIMTIHMSKGLEFDYVFPLGLSSRTPTQEIDVEESDSEKLRQFYVALTRAKEKVSVPIIVLGKTKKIEKGTASCCELFFTSHLEDPYPVIEKMDEAFYLQQIEKMQNTASYDSLFEKIPLAAYTHPSSSNLIWQEPSAFTFANSYTLSFTHLQQKHAHEYIEIEEDKAILPLGAQTGVFLHSLIQKIMQKKIIDVQKRKEYIHRTSTYWGYEKYHEPIETLIEKVFAMHLRTDTADFLFSAISMNDIFSEMEFIFSHANKQDMIKGVIDLLFLHEKKYYILDWKSNYLHEGYDQSSMLKAMEQNDYYLQASLYSAAVKKYLASIDPRPFDEIFGGAFYIFLRGLSDSSSKGVFFFTPDLAIKK